MLLVIDIGNTHTVLGVFEGEDLRQDWRVSTDKRKTGDEYSVLIRSICSGSGLSFEAFKAVAISCVVPPLLHPFQEFCRKALRLEPLIVEPGIKTGMPILMDNPREVGADRIVNAVAAYREFRKACIVVDFGTATTFDCVSAEGEYLGGVIVPGIGISLEALFQSASKLPRVEIARPRTVIGKNTIHGMQSGILYGYVSMVDGMVGRIRREMGVEAFVIATGGMAERIAPESHSIQKVDRYLTLRGLQILYELNRKEDP
jgi:type III pantothenate kinase